jgi:hypothetical protein
MNWVLICYLLVVVVALIAVALTRKEKGIGVRVIQFVTVAVVVPGLIVLRVEEKVSSDAVMSLLGALVGYVLANIREFKPKGERNSTRTD